MHRKNLWALAITAVALLMGACATPTPETIIEQVVVTEIVEVPGETTFVEVTAAPRGKCSPTDLAGLEELKIGVTVPLSAPGFVIGGRAMQTAINIAVDEVNSAGGVLGLPVDVVFYDTSALSERGTAAMEYFATQECVVAVVGEYHSAAGVAMKEISNKYHIPTVFNTWDDTITSVGYPEVFRVSPTSSIVAEADVNFIESLGAEFVVIMTESTDYGISAAEATTEMLAARGIESETYQADLGTQDFASVIARIQEGPTPDVVLVLITGETSYNFEQQAAVAGLTPTADTVCIANQVAANSTDYWTNVPDGNYCTFRQVGLVPSLANDVTKAFEAEYRKHFDTFPESYAL
jgi:ABC-type branched-subunit amino acid transport system substrate-binding protein